VCTENYEKFISRLFRLLATNPARVLGVDDVRGQLAEGYLADIIIWEPESESISDMNIRSDSPYAHERLFGRVLEVYLRGTLTYRYSEMVLPNGQLVTPHSFR
jgi:allantoinase